MLPTRFSPLIFTSPLGGKQSLHQIPHFTDNETKIQLSDLCKIIQSVKPRLEARHSVAKFQGLSTTASCSKLLEKYLFYCTMLNISTAAIAVTTSS